MPEETSDEIVQPPQGKSVLSESKQNFNKFLTEDEIMNRMNYIQK